MSHLKDDTKLLNKILIIGGIVILIGAAIFTVIALRE